MRRLIFFFLLSASLLQAQTQIGNDIDGQFNFDFMGWDVAISDDAQRIVVGASNYSVNADSAGQVKVFQFDGSDWIQIGSDLLGAAEGDNFGRSVDISGDGTIIAVGAHVSDLGGFNSGAVQIFEFNGTAWIQKGNTLTGSNDDDEFGSFVALSADGNRLAVGAPYTDNSTLDNGVLRIFDFDGNQWNQVFEHFGDEANDVFGMSLDMSRDGNHVVCGAWINVDGTTKEGYAKVFEFDNVSWSQVGQTITGETAGNFFGASSSISDDGTIVAVGSWGNDETGTDAGEVEVFQLVGNSWQALGSDIQGDSGFQRFGWAIDLSANGELLVVGAPQEGNARFFRFENNDWTMIGNAIPGEGINNEFGFSLALSQDGTKTVIGDPDNDDVAISSGAVQVYDLTDLLSVQEFGAFEFDVFPNPAYSQLNIFGNTQFSRVMIYDMNGRQLKKIAHDSSEQSISIDISELNSGIYFLKIDGSDKQEIIQFIKN